MKVDIFVPETSLKATDSDPRLQLSRAESQVRSACSWNVYADLIGKSSRSSFFNINTFCSFMTGLWSPLTVDAEEEVRISCRRFLRSFGKGAMARNGV